MNYVCAFVDVIHAAIINAIILPVRIWSYGKYIRMKKNYETAE